MKIISKIGFILMITNYCLVMVFTASMGSLSTMKMNTKFNNFNKKTADMVKLTNNQDNLKAPKNLTADDLPDDVPIYYQGWIKYFHYHRSPEENKSKKPKFFFKNEAFKNQNQGEEQSDQVSFYLFNY